MGGIAAFLGLALIITITLAWHSYKQGGDFLYSVLFGSIVGVFAAHFLYRYTYIIIMRIARGAPFRNGDRIEIIDGLYKGSTARVQEEFNEFYVRAILEHETANTDIKVLHWNEIRKIRT